MQDAASRQAADARLAVFAGRGGFWFAAVSVLLTMTFVLAVLTSALTTTGTPEQPALAIDFKVFWAAAQLALSGDGLAAFDQDQLNALHATKTDARMPWLYPPGYLLLIAPLGAFSFAHALILSTALSLICMALAFRPFVAGVPPLWMALTFAPAFLPALMIGQNSLFWMAGLLAALAALRAQRWVLAGICIGCLTLKPQLGLMIPFALLGAGAWRSIVAAAVTAALVAGLPTLVYGTGYWPLLAQAIAEQGAVMLQSIAGVELMVGPLSLLTMSGVEPRLALRLQWAITAACAVCVLLLWRSRNISFDAKAAGLLTAMLLSSVYMWYYEAALMAGIALFLMRAGLLKAAPLPLAVFVALWLGGGLLAMNVFLKLVDQSLLGAVVLTPLLGVCLILCLAHLASARRAPARPV
ncbi:glycosyltransferase family 87 protein [Tabrizicola sp. YIM 78059]|uniref:glycosyltransferase family 87 protein n=1 Tax=Tabrizicola sp. YIM 78059 TaxID=2529861 RepID=UPI0010AA5D49|nr:glycosyltransferase family 87 protein [Tabrizicola sp. YIM 78059]